MIIPTCINSPASFTQRIALFIITLSFITIHTFFRIDAVHAEPPRLIMTSVEQLRNATQDQYQPASMRIGYVKATLAGLRRQYEAHFFTPTAQIIGRISAEGNTTFIQMPIRTERRQAQWQSAHQTRLKIDLDQLLLDAESRVRKDDFTPNGVVIVSYQFYPSHKNDGTGREKTQVFFEVQQSDKARVVSYEGTTFAAHRSGKILKLPTLRPVSIKLPQLEPREINLSPNASSAVQRFTTEQGETLLRIAGDFLFDFDSDQPRAEAGGLARELAAIIQQDAPRQIFVEGHTDSWGSPPYNDDLSQRRAKAVADLLTAAGIAPSSLVIKGYGETQPVAAEVNANGKDDPAGRQLNRRVEVRYR